MVGLVAIIVALGTQVLLLTAINQIIVLILILATAPTKLARYRFVVRVSGAFSWSSICADV